MLRERFNKSGPTLRQLSVLRAQLTKLTFSRVQSGEKNQRMKAMANTSIGQEAQQKASRLACLFGRQCEAPGGFNFLFSFDSPLVIFPKNLV